MLQHDSEAYFSDNDQPSPVLLFVDDEPNILKSLRRLFHGQGYRILLANNGEEGLHCLESEQVSLVISDMRMPGMDGAQFLEQVRRRWPDVMRLLLTGYSDISSTVAAINRGEIFRYIAKPWDDTDIQLIVRDALAHQRLKKENERLLDITRGQNKELKALNASLEEKVNERTQALRETMERLEQAHGDLKKNFLNTVHAFSGLIDMREARLGGHSRRVANYSRKLAAKFDFDEGGCQDLMLAGLLHDIGKIGLSDDILRTPYNALTAEQRQQVIKHPVTGEQALMAVTSLHGVAGLIRHHHERFDGNGYPDGLKGLEIPFGARILTVVNEYDALQTGTLTLRPLKPSEACQYLLDNAGKRYDPEVVRMFLRVIQGKSTDQAEDLPLAEPYKTEDLHPGMILARDLLHRDGYLLLATGFVLDERMIDRLRRLEVTEGETLVLHIAPASIPQGVRIGSN